MTDAEKLYVESLEAAVEEKKLHLVQCCDAITHYRDVITHNEKMLALAVEQKEIVKAHIKKDEEFNAKYIESLWE